MPKVGLASPTQLRVSTRMARRLPALADKLGFDGAALCRRHRIDPNVLDDRSARVPLERIAAAFEELLETSGHPSLGLELSQNAEPGAYHTPALVLLASNTLREGLARAFQFQRLWGDGQRFALAESAVLGCRGRGLGVSFRIPAVRRPGHGILEVCALAETMTAARNLTGRANEAALAVGLPSTTDSLSALRDFFGVEPELGVKVAFVVLSTDVADARLLHANSLYLSIFERQAAEEIEALPAEGDLLSSVRLEITRGLARGRFALGDCAESLGMSGRTLERRLSELGVPFQEVVESVRRELALRLLEEPRAIEEVALLLGYTERSSFHRACLGWFGKTPRAMRQG
jgi:AraC-like DNA-binding protein